MTDVDLEMDIDEMAADIFEQTKPKKPINDLRDIGKYNPEFTRAQQNDSEDKFDILYRTPQNANIDLLKPDKYNIIENAEDDDEFSKNPNIRAYYSGNTDQIYVRPEEFYTREEDPINQKYNTQERYLIHENTHRQQAKHSYNNTFKASSPKVKTEYDYMKDTWQDKKPTRLINDLELLHNQFALSDAEIDPKKANRIIKSRPAELYPIFTQYFPEQVINPKNKLARKVNRLWFD